MAKAGIDLGGAVKTAKSKSKAPARAAKTPTAADQRKLVQRDGAKRMTFALDQDDYVRLTTYAAKAGKPKHVIIEDAVLAFLREEGV